MLHRNKIDSHSHKRVYRGLGGKAEQGENPFDCIKREVREEAGLTIEPIWRGIVTFSNPFGNDWEAHIFTAEEFTGELKKCPEGDLCWIDESELINLEMPEGDKKLIPFLFKEDKFHAHLKYDDKKNLVGCNVDIL